MSPTEAGHGFVWIGLHEPDQEEFADLAELFGLHPLAIEDAVHVHQQPKVERYGETLFAVFKTVCYVEHAELTATSEVVDTGELMAFIGASAVTAGSEAEPAQDGSLTAEVERRQRPVMVCASRPGGRAGRRDRYPRPRRCRRGRSSRAAP